MILPWHRADLQRLASEGAGMPHAILIRGPEGIGKLEFARSLTQALLCEGVRIKGLACESCASCDWVSQAGHPDFRVVATESEQDSGDEGQGDKKRASVQIGVEQIRALTEFVNLSSHRNRGKVILIHPAEAMNTAAANALLKSLEEPPPATYFLLVSHRWHQVPATVKSRCRQVILTAPDREAAQAWLSEQGTAQPEIALAHAGGAPVAAARFEPEYWEQRAEFVATIAKPDFDPLSAAENLRDLAPANLVRWLQQWSYDMALHSVSGEARYHPDFTEAVGRVARRASLINTLRFHRQMVASQRIVHHPLNPRLFLEELLLNYRALVNTQGSERVT